MDPQQQAELLKLLATQDPLHTGITLAFVVIGLVALFYVHKATRYLADLRGIKVTDAQQQMIDDAVMKGVAYAEEQAHKLATKITDGQDVDKLHLAETAARSIAPQALTGVTTEQFQVRAEAALQSMRPVMASVAPSERPPAQVARHLTIDRNGVATIPRAPSLPTFHDVEPPTPVPPKAKR